MRFACRCNNHGIKRAKTLICRQQLAGHYCFFVDMATLNSPILRRRSVRKLNPLPAPKLLVVDQIAESYRIETPPFAIHGYARTADRFAILPTRPRQRLHENDDLALFERSAHCVTARPGRG